MGSSRPVPTSPGPASGATFYDTGQAEPLEACSEGTEGITFYNSSVVPKHLDRSIYQWNVVDSTWTPPAT